MRIVQVQSQKILPQITRAVTAKKGVASSAAKLGAIGITPWAFAEMMQEPASVNQVKKYAGQNSSPSCEASASAHWHESPGYDVC